MSHKQASGMNLSNLGIVASFEVPSLESVLDGSFFRKLSPLSRSPPASISTFRKMPDGEHKWRQAWNDFLDSEYQPKDSYPDVAELLRPYKTAIEHFTLLENTRRCHRTALYNQQHLVASLNVPKPHIEGVITPYAAFQIEWLSCTDEEREDLLREAMIVAIGPPSGEDPHTRDGHQTSMELCPELSSSFLQRDGGRGFLDLLATIVGPGPIARSPEIHPILISHPVFDKMWKIGAYEGQKKIKYVTLYGHWQVAIRTIRICSMLFAAVAGLYRIPLRHNKGEKLQDVKYLLRLNSKSQFLGEGEIDYLKKMYKDGEWLCHSCEKQQPPGGPNKFLQCAKCKALGRKVLYCDKKCQKDDWKAHKVICGKLFDAEAGPAPVPVISTPSMYKLVSSRDGFSHSPPLRRQISLLNGRQEDGVLYYLFYTIQYGSEGIEPVRSLVPTTVFETEAYRDEAFRYGKPLLVAQLCCSLEENTSLPFSKLLAPQLSEEFGIDLEELRI